MEYMKDDVVCTQCQGEFEEDEVILFDDEIFCESCADEYTGLCEDCNERTWNNDAYSSHNHFLCHSCFNATIVGHKSK